MIRPTIILLASIFLVSARPTQALAQAVPPAIASIRMRFAEINKDTSNFRRVRIDMDSAGFERESTDGGEVEAYFDGHEMRRATATYFGEHGSAIYDIYYQHRRPFFVHVVEKSSGEKLYGPQHIEKEIRIYLDKGSLIRFMIGQKLESVTERENLKTANVARELAAEIVRRVK